MRLLKEELALAIDKLWVIDSIIVFKTVIYRMAPNFRSIKFS